MKNVNQFFAQGKFKLSGSYFSTLYTYFTNPLLATTSRNIAYTQFSQVAG